MKTQSFAWVLGLSLGFGCSLISAQALQRVEISVQAALIPPVGLDDNDRVPVVMHGYLPNQCFVLAEAEARPNPDGHSFDVHQYAYRREDEVCTAGRELPPQISAMIPFNTELKLPSLPSARYALRFWPNIRQPVSAQMRGFEVTQAHSRSIDEQPYAVISKALAPMVVQAGTPVTVMLSGALNSSCMELARVQVDLIGDTFIVLPLTRMREGEVCIQRTSPFVIPVVLKPKNPGLYLVHVRSLSGEAVNEVFEAVR